jgi:hypothetical protein
MYSVETIKKAVDEGEITTVDLAKGLGLYRTTTYKHLNGEIDVTVKQLGAYSRVLDARRRYLATLAEIKASMG